jgi:DNA ligase-1
MQLHAIAALSEGLGRTGSRLARIQALADSLRNAAPQDVGVVAAWLSGELPQGRIGIGPAAVQQALGASFAPPEPRLTVAEVDTRLAAIATISGGGAATRRGEALGQLFSASTTSERAFLAGLLTGSLRQGALDGLMMAAMALAWALPEAAVRRAVMLRGALPPVALALAERGPSALVDFDLQLFRPVLPMLADTAPDLESLMPESHELVIEAKLDGARIQVHRDGDTVRIWSRALNEVTDSLPEIVAAARACPVRSFIADGEVLAHTADGRPAPFQTTMRRFGRRLDVDAMARALPLSAFLFDVLAADGASLLDQPLSERRQALQALTAETTAWRATPAVVSPNPTELKAFFDATLAAGHEGIMAKTLNSTYQAGARGSQWLKLKPAKTLDLVVIAAEMGSGRRQGTLSNLHLAVRNTDPAGPPFVMVGKTFKGLTDAMLAWQTRELLAREIDRKDHVVFVRPELVVEVAFQEFERSPRYPGGLALRFARVRAYRNDKTAEAADTLETARALAAFSADAPADAAPPGKPSRGSARS